MSSFTEKLIVSLEPNGRKWKLEEDFTYYTEIFKDKGIDRYYITVPAGFETDFASVPKIFILLLRWRDKFNKASVVHDWLYHTKEVPRRIADRIFLEGLTILGIPKWKAYLFYWVVRLLGWTHWKRKNKKEGDKNENPIAV
jgi:hypothetical protein